MSEIPPFPGIFQVKRVPKQLHLINMKAEMQIRSLNQKIDLLLEEQIKTLFDTQEKQFVLLQEINAKLENSTVKP